VGRGASLKRLTETDRLNEDSTPDEALAIALLRLSRGFVPALSTTIGESITGRAVMIQVAWPAG
jgi:acetyl-CoA carboxylase alpha subunit